MTDAHRDEAVAIDVKLLERRLRTAVRAFLLSNDALVEAVSGECRQREMIGNLKSTVMCVSLATTQIGCSGDLRLAPARISNSIDLSPARTDFAVAERVQLGEKAHARAGRDALELWCG